MAWMRSPMPEAGAARAPIRDCVQNQMTSAAVVTTRRIASEEVKTERPLWTRGISAGNYILTAARDFKAIAVSGSFAVTVRRRWRAPVTRNKTTQIRGLEVQSKVTSRW